MKTDVFISHIDGRYIVQSRDSIRIFDDIDECLKYANSFLSD